MTSKVNPEKIIGEVVSRCEENRLREATRDIIAPLIHRAEVSDELRNKALAPPPAGVHPTETSWPAETVADVLDGFVEEGTLRKNARGAYELGTEPTDPTPKEAARLAQEILAGWPEAEVAKIRDVLLTDTDGAEDDEETE